MTRSLIAISFGLCLAIRPGHADPFVDFNCVDRLVYCIDSHGKELPHERASFRVSDTVVITVIDESDDEVVTSIDVDASAGSNVLLPTIRAPDKAIRSVTRIAAKTYKIPDTDGIQIIITQKRKEAVVNVAGKSLSIPDTLYFARPALAFTWIRDGSRKITAEHTVVTTTDFLPAVALQFWPWGHRSRTLSGFEKCGPRLAGDLISLQIGTHLDLTNPFKRAFFGLTIEPISGIGFSTGIAVTTGQFFSGGPASSTDGGITEDTMWNPYFSFTITPELYDALRKIVGKKE